MAMPLQAVARPKAEAIQLTLNNHPVSLGGKGVPLHPLLGFPVQHLKDMYLADVLSVEEVAIAIGCYAGVPVLLKLGIASEGIRRVVNKIGMEVEVIIRGDPDEVRCAWCRASAPPRLLRDGRMVCDNESVSHGVKGCERFLWEEENLYPLFSLD